MTKTDFNTWLEELNNKRRDYWNTNYTHREYTPIQVQEGKKYIKLISDSSVWGFVSKVNGILKGSPIEVGDLLMPASWSTPARHSRGNILRGTDSWGFHGPTYR